MHATYRTAICVVSLAVLASLAMGQARQAIPPSEANFFIGTPAGWVHPKTQWGDPDLQGIWPLNHVGLTPLQRCYARQRFPGAAPDKIAACDPNKLFLTEEEFKTVIATAQR
jgi:hypothetical protein